MSCLKSMLPLLVALAPLCSSFAPVEIGSRAALVSENARHPRASLHASRRRHDGDLFEDRTAVGTNSPPPNAGIDGGMFERAGRAATSALLLSRAAASRWALVMKTGLEAAAAASCFLRTSSSSESGGGRAAVCAAGAGDGAGGKCGRGGGGGGSVPPPPPLLLSLA